MIQDPEDMEMKHPEGSALYTFVFKVTKFGVGVEAGGLGQVILSLCLWIKHLPNPCCSVI